MLLILRWGLASEWHIPCRFLCETCTTSFCGELDRSCRLLLFGSVFAQKCSELPLNGPRTKYGHTHSPYSGNELFQDLIFGPSRRTNPPHFLLVDSIHVVGEEQEVCQKPLFTGYCAIADTVPVVFVWIDQDLCTGDGLCVDHCPDVFVQLEDGIAYVANFGNPHNDPGGSGSLVEIPERHLSQVIQAAEVCPGECIFIEATD